MSPNRHRICSICSAKWISDVGGKGGRAGDRCDNCYSIYRRAVNLYYSARHRAEDKDLEFDLNVDDIEKAIKGSCSKTGIQFDLSPNGKDYTERNPFCPSIDRIDPTRGYTPLNIQYVCWIYNVAKQRFTDNEVLDFCQKVVNFSGMKPAPIAEVAMP